MSTVLAIDAGTTGVTALLVRDDATIAARGYCEFAQHFPEPGWVEHDPEEIWQAVLTASAAALDGATEPPVAIGVTNQRETVCLWDRSTLRAPRRGLVWQDRRTAEICRALVAAGHEPRVAELTGLRLDPYFSGTKLTWLAHEEPAVWAGVVAGETAVGTVDSYLLARLTGGAAHATEPSNASRTLLYDITTGRWSTELADLLGVPLSALPEVRPSAGPFGVTDPNAFLGLTVPITGVLGDQQAALFGQACFAPGESKCTFGTGSFVLVNTGADLVRAPGGLLTTVAWDLGQGLVYALEGAVFVTGAAVQWLRDGLGLIETAADVEALARQVEDSGGLVLVPALTGLGAPHWDPDARGALLGITRGTTAAHIAHATLEAIAFQVRDVVDAMTGGAGLPLTELSVDGGASANDLLCALQADQLGVPVRRPTVLETTGFGAALVAGLGAGVWPSTEALRDVWHLDRRFDPTPGRRDDGRHERWQSAVERSKGWARL